MKMILSVFLALFSFNSFGFDKHWSDVFFVKAEEESLSKAKKTHRSLVVREIGYYKDECDIDEGNLTYTSPTPQCEKLTSGSFRCHNVVSVVCREKSRALKKLPWSNNYFIHSHGVTLSEAEKKFGKSKGDLLGDIKKQCDGDKGTFSHVGAKPACQLGHGGYQCWGSLVAHCKEKASSKASKKLPWSERIFAVGEHKWKLQAQQAHDRMAVSKTDDLLMECAKAVGWTDWKVPTPDCWKAKSGKYVCSSKSTFRCTKYKPRFIAADLPWAESQQVKAFGKELAATKASYDKEVVKMKTPYQNQCSKDKGVFHSKSPAPNCRLLSKDFGYFCLGDLTVICTKN